MHPSESGHWYDKTGGPVYEITGANGNRRPTTLRDAKKHGYVPGVSTILGCCDKPGLNIWKIDQAIMAALTLPRIEGESSDSFVARVKVDAKETAKKAAERGTAIHAAIQGAYEGEPSTGYTLHVQGAMSAVNGWMAQRWTPERSFSHPLGFGGKADLSSSVAVLDFKSKEFDESTSLKTWDEHAMQLAAYREGLGMPQARAAICYVSVTTPGLAKLIEIPEEDLKKGWKCFYSLLQFWKAKSGFESSFERLAA